MNFKYRSYQEKQKEDLDKYMKSKDKKALFVAPVGSGKSLITAMFADYSEQPTLVIQPNSNLLMQNYEKALMLGLEPTIYSASLKKKVVSNLIYATPGSVANNPDAFKHIELVVIDEAHLGLTRTLSNGKIKKVSKTEEFLDKIKPKKVLGLTATPILLVNTIEGSKIQMLNRSKRSYFCFAPIYHVTQIKDIKDKYWAEFEYEENLDYDTSKLVLNSSGNDFKLDSIIESYRVNNLTKQISEKLDYLTLNRNKKHILIFMPDIEQAEELASKDNRVVCLHSKMVKKDKEKIIKDFKSGKIRILANVGMLTTGFDFPELDCIVMARDTNSYQLYHQIVGRIVRPFPGKKGLVVDMVSNYNRFGNIADVTYEDARDYNGWTMFKGNKIMTGHCFEYLEDYPTRKATSAEFDKFPETEEDPVFYFGKYKGMTVSHVASKNKGYLTWIINNKEFKWFGSNGNKLKKAIKDLLSKDVQEVY